MNELPNPLREIDLKDKRFRIAQTVFMFIVGAAFIGTFGFLVVLLTNAQDQLAQQRVLLDQQKTLSVQQKEATEELKKDTSAKLDRQAEYIKCIAKLFAEHEAGTTTIDNLELCAVTERPLDSLGFGQQSENTPSARNVEPPLVSKTDPPAEPAPQPQPQPEPQEEHPPVEILGVPMCVPLTDLCIRE